MSLTYEGLLALYPEDSAEISKISSAELDNINKYLSGEISTFAPKTGSVIEIQADTGSHEMSTDANPNHGNGGWIRASARGYRARKIPEFAPGSGYDVTLQGSMINLRVGGIPYFFASSVGQLQNSHANGIIV